MMEKDPKKFAKFISSTETESSEIQAQVIDLGKKLVKELDLEDSTDTLSRWVSHYLAKQIQSLEQSSESNNLEIEERCFDTILKLWNNQNGFPNGLRPFESFEPILKVIQQLDPNNSAPLYLPQYIFVEKDMESLLESHSDSDSDSDSDEDEDEDESNKQLMQHWLDIALKIDKTARILIKHSLDEAVKLAVNQEIIEWLKPAYRIIEVRRTIEPIFNILPHNYGSLDEDARDALEVEYERLRIEKSLSSKISEIEDFQKFADEIKLSLLEELKTVQKYSKA